MESAFELGKQSSLSCQVNFTGCFPVYFYHLDKLERSSKGIRPQFLLFIYSFTHQIFVYSVSSTFQALCKVLAAEWWTCGDPSWSQMGHTDTLVPLSCSVVAWDTCTGTDVCTLSPHDLFPRALGEPGEKHSTERKVGAVPHAASSWSSLSVAPANDYSQTLETHIDERKIYLEFKNSNSYFHLRRGAGWYLTGRTCPCQPMLLSPALQHRNLAHDPRPQQRPRLKRLSGTGPGI